MKRVLKSASCPQALKQYAQANPHSSWQEMQGDAANDATIACRIQAAQDQHGLCAYCEQKIEAHNPLKCRVEHFHPKSEHSSTKNWGLDWNNMLAVCDGGSNTPKEARSNHPLPANLSCDAHKNHSVQKGSLQEACEGQILNPLTIPVFPNFFCCHKGTGHIGPNESECATLQIPGNCYTTTLELVQNTINVLNLNCERLAERRRLLVVNIDKNKKAIRQKNTSPQKATELYELLVKRYFKTPWPEFFTTIRCCLGQAAEDHLHSIKYQG